MATIQDHIQELEECLAKGQLLDSFAVRPVVRSLKFSLKQIEAMQTALADCWELLDEAEKDEINIRDEMEKWERAYGHFLPSNDEH